MMLSFLIDTLLLSYRAPRAAARRVLDVFTGYEAIALIFAVSFALSSFLTLVVIYMGGRTTVGLGFVLPSLVVSLVAYAIAVLLIHRIGALFGGRASLRDIAAVVAWHSLATVIFAPLVTAATLPGLSAGMLGLLAIGQLAMIGVVIWLLASFVAEAHGFAGTLRVVGVMLCGLFMLGFVLSFLMPNLMIVP